MQIRGTARALACASLLALALGLGLAVAIGWTGFVAPAGATSALAPLPASDYATRALCAAPAPRSAGCLAVELVPRTAAARAHTRPLAITSTRPLTEAKASEGAYGYRPQDLHSGYELPTEQLNAATNPQTIGIVDAYDDVNAEADLAVYDQEFGLPPCTHASGCFTKLNQYGQSQLSSLPDSSSPEARGWAGEIATDVETAHAVCQDCHILLVEARSAENGDLDTAENTAVAHGAGEISNSWGGPEQSGEDTRAFEHPGTVITVAAGDNGYLDWDAKESSEKGLPDYPATSSDVVAVGGTRLILHASGSWKEETVWNGDGAGGGGCSTLYGAPSWQPSSAVGCGSARAVADVSADADPYRGVAVYDSTPGSTPGNTGWATIGGTSVASPIIASTFALAGGAHGVVDPAETLYANLTASPGALHDVTSGSNGSCGEPFNEETGISGCSTSAEAAACAETAICNATTGYDGPSGVGTPIGLTAFLPTSHQHIPEVEVEKTGNEGETATTSGNEGSQGGKEPGSGNPESSGSGGAAGGGATQGSGATTPVGSSAPTSGAAKRAAIASLSGLTLTLSAISALNHAHPRTSQIGFAFTLSLAARVRVTLARQVRLGGHAHWQTQPGSFTVAARAGRTRAHMKAAQRLPAGRYLLTCSPAHGTPQSLVLVLG